MISETVSLPLLDHFSSSQNRWNTQIVTYSFPSKFRFKLTLKYCLKREVGQILESASSHPEWMSHKVRERPPSGAQFLFYRDSSQHFKADGYEWKRRKEGRLIREDHMKLKIQKVEAIFANYAHSAVVPTFHRRIYWLILKPSIVLVHYLNCSDEESNPQQTLADKISQLLQKCNLNLSYAQLVAQVTPILCTTLNLPQIKSLCADVMRLAGSQPRLSAPQGLCRRNSCSSASRRGLSSLAMARQPSAFSDSLDQNFLSAVDSNCGRDCAEEPTTQNTMLATCHSRMSEDEPDEPAPPSEWSRISNQLLDDTAPTSRSDWSMAWASTSECSMNTAAPIDICPNTSNCKGGERILIVGGWYMQPHSYCVHFGDSIVQGKLLKVGVLSCIAPPRAVPGRISVSVSCDGVMVSSAVDFIYTEKDQQEPPSILLQSLADRVHLVAAAFNSTLDFGGTVDECWALRVLHSLRGRSLFFPALLSLRLPSRTLLHLAAALGFLSLTEFLLFWRADFPLIREFDPFAIDLEGKTPLHYAVAAKQKKCANALAAATQKSVDVVTNDEEGVAYQREDEDEHEARTALWVQTHGERVTSSAVGDLPLEINIDTHVHVPDSPSMAHLFHTVTSPGVIVDGGTRGKMALLARQIIDALPSCVKTHSFKNWNQQQINEGFHQADSSFLHPHTQYYNLVDYCNSDALEANNSRPTHPHSLHIQDWLHRPEYSHVIGTERERERVDEVAVSLISSLDVDFRERELGEFFSPVTERDIHPLQQQLDNLKLSVEEQREVYEAALKMEHDLHYGSELETRAALTIQNCYRKYKQFCYVRRLHKAAVVVQKHFRLRRLNQKEENHQQVQEHPSCDGQTICIQVPNDSLQREHMAAATIQNAYRGHRKRQAAAKVIQNFFRQTRHKLRKSQEVSGGVSMSTSFMQTNLHNGLNGSDD